jgi:hypothetical protein
MQINIVIKGDELDSRTAAKQMRTLAALVKDGALVADGYNIEYDGTFHFDVDFGDAYPHGDYTDAEGNLLHIANDHVVNVTWAKTGAEQEDVNVPVEDWIKEHGGIFPAGHAHGEAEGHEH